MGPVNKLVVHCKREPFDVYIGRPGKWGNPFSHLQVQATQAKFKVASREDAVNSYRKWLMEQPELVAAAKTELKGKVLGCWCKVKGDELCHGDVLSEIANE
jgi:hypothetical protein